VHHAFVLEVVQDHIQWRQGIQWLQANILAIPAIIIMKLGRFVLPDVESSNKMYVVVSVTGYLPFLALWLAGIPKLIRYGATLPKWLVLHLAFAATVFTAFVFWGSPRFRDANPPLLMIYAACGAESLISTERI